MKKLNDETLEKVNNLVKESKTDAALDVLYDYIDGLFIKGDFKIVDNIIRKIEVKEYSTDILIGLLLLTNWAKDKLKHREKFAKRARKIIKTRREMETDLLKGID